MQMSSIVLKNAWLGYHIKKTHSIVILGVLGILCLDSVLEIKVLPLFYTGISTPFKATFNPIGGALLPATFFHVLLIAANVFGFAYVLQKVGFDLGLTPKTRNDWLEVTVIFTFLISGMAMWYLPILFLAFLISGLLVVAVQLS